jgi:creatinine amidohydrolase
MRVKLMPNFDHVRAELMRPEQIRDALAKRSVAYIPIGATEFHQEHLPIGLDTLNAQGLTCMTASRTGGVVLPPLYVGTGGGHKSYPWTIMMEGSKEIRAILENTLKRLEEFEIELAVIFSGHFAPEQLDLIDSITKDWNSSGNRMKTIALGINMEIKDSISPDHAGIFETTVLSYFHPECIDISALPDIQEFPVEDFDEDVFGLQRHDPDHILWGIFGPDPRNYDPELAEALVTKLSHALEQAVLKALN